VKTNQEKRHFSRFHIDGSTALIIDGQNYPAELLDISLNGALCNQPSTATLEIGVKCTLSTTLSNSDITITMQGHVVHHSTQNLGIHCEYIDLDSITHLKRLVELNLGDEAILERELADLGNMAHIPDSN
jgi:hypothetical protein